MGAGKQTTAPACVVDNRALLVRIWQAEACQEPARIIRRLASDRGVYACHGQHRRLPRQFRPVRKDRRVGRGVGAVPASPAEPLWDGGLYGNHGDGCDPEQGCAAQCRPPIPNGKDGLWQRAESWANGHRDGILEAPGGSLWRRRITPRAARLGPRQRCYLARTRGFCEDLEDQDGWRWDLKNRGPSVVRHTIIIYLCVLERTARTY